MERKLILISARSIHGNPASIEAMMRHGRKAAIPSWHETGGSRQ